MYNERIYLTPQDILEKDFKIDARGYRPQEVDKFLDKDIKDLIDDNSKLKQNIRSLNEELEIAKQNESATKTLTNVDLLKRISQLEKVVFGKEE